MCSHAIPQLCQRLGLHVSDGMLEVLRRSDPDSRQWRQWLLGKCGVTEADVAPLIGAAPGGALPGRRINKTPCRHLGEPTGEKRDCTVCGGGKQIPLHVCAVHGSCTPGKYLPETAWCRTCPDHEPVEEVKIPAALPPFVGRVVLINLRSRTDRLERFRALQKERGWPLAEPVVLPAIRGDTVGVPSFFTQGGGAYGCRQSHCRVLEDCLMDGVDSVLVLEDDVEWFDDAWQRLDAFLKAVPADWDQLMLGGQHQRAPERVAPGVVRCKQTERTHAYAVRGKALKSLLHLWYSSTVHIDWDMGRRWQKDWKVYAPEPFAFGQGGGKSDISGRYNPPQHWIEPKDYTVVVLDAPPGVVRQLREHNWHTGYTRNRDDRDAGLEEITKLTDVPTRKRKLRKWIDTLAWECASLRDAVLTVWHPGVTAELARSVHPRVVEIRAASAEEAIEAWGRVQT